MIASGAKPSARPFSRRRTSARSAASPSLKTSRRAVVGFERCKEQAAPCVRPTPPPFSTQAAARASPAGADVAVRGEFFQRSPPPRSIGPAWRTFSLRRNSLPRPANAGRARRAGPPPPRLPGCPALGSAADGRQRRGEFRQRREVAQRVGESARARRSSAPLVSRCRTLRDGGQRAVSTMGKFLRKPTFAHGVRNASSTALLQALLSAAARAAAANGPTRRAPLRPDDRQPTPAPAAAPRPAASGLAGNCRAKSRPAAMASGRRRARDKRHQPDERQIVAAREIRLRHVAEGQRPGLVARAAGGLREDRQITRLPTRARGRRPGRAATAAARRGRRDCRQRVTCAGESSSRRRSCQLPES